MLTVRKQRAKLINDLPPESRKLIEDVVVDRYGNFIPKLYSKSEANRELRKFHNIGSQTDRSESDVSRLSDAELIRQLADQAKELGIEIGLNYSFAQQPSATERDGQDSQVIDADPPSGASSASALAADSATDVSNPPELTSELSVSSAAPPEARRLPKAGRGKR
jgi:hypothetical protein